MSWEPVEHRSPYKRFDFGPKPRPDEPAPSAIAEAVQQAAREIRMRECERLWRHLVEVAQGG